MKANLKMGLGALAACATAWGSTAIADGGQPLLSMDGQFTTVEGVAPIDDFVGGGDGCSTIVDTIGSGWNTGTGWTISDGAVGLWGPANPFSSATDVTLCDITVVAGHVTGTNQYTLWILPDAGGCPDDPANAIASYTLSNLPPFGSSATPTTISTGDVCLEGGVRYWIGLTADGGGSTWGAWHFSTTTFLDRCNYNYDGTWSSFGNTDAGTFTITANDGCGGGLGLEIFGDCPGDVRATVTGATPGGTVALVYSPSSGTCTIPSGPCAGTTLDLGCGGIMQVATATADGGGVANFSGNAPPAACGGCVQAIDAATCATSNVVCL
ncbi:MAG: hypothetical protein ACF8PN_06360 [Phycisphaerales bacterium]